MGSFKEGKIGFFDSGIGGTSIWKEVVDLMPQENTLFLADGKNAPYGEKGQERILELSIKNTEFLLNRGCKIIVVACNTATTNAISYLRNNYQVPFIGIEPAIKPAALDSKTGKIGVLATRGTLSSKLFNQTSTKFTQEIEVIEQDGDGIVDLIETGKLHSSEMIVLLKKYLIPMIEKKIDHLVLGCTHYPYLIPIIKKIIPNNIKIIDSGLAVAKQTKKVLMQNELLRDYNREKGQHIFYTNRDVQLLSDFLPTDQLNIAVEFENF